MLLGPVFAIVTSVTCLAPTCDGEISYKPQKKVEIRLAETQPADGLIESKVICSKNKI